MNIQRITSDREIQFAIEQMFRFKNSWGISQMDAMKLAFDVCKSCFLIHKITYDSPLPDSFAKIYTSKHGAWQHQGGNTLAHNNLGMRWAGKMMQEGFDVTLDDSPDIYCNYETNGHKVVIRGDVGQCSFFPAFFDSGFQSSPHDLWVSVFHWGEFIMEAMTYPKAAVEGMVFDHGTCEICGYIPEERAS